MRDWINEGVDPAADAPDAYEMLLSWLGRNAPLELVERAVIDINTAHEPLVTALRDLLAAVEQATSDAHDYIANAAVDLANDEPF